MGKIPVRGKNNRTLSKDKQIIEIEKYCHDEKILMKRVDDFIKKSRATHSSDGLDDERSPLEALSISSNSLLRRQSRSLSPMSKRNDGKHRGVCIVRKGQITLAQKDCLQI